MSFREPSYGVFLPRFASRLHGVIRSLLLLLYIELFALQVCHMSGELAAYAPVAVNASSAFGRVLPNYVADKFGPLNVHIPFTFVVGLLAFRWQAVQSPAGLLIFDVLYGFFSGTFVSLKGPIVAGLSVSTPSSHWDPTWYGYVMCRYWPVGWKPHCGKRSLKVVVGSGYKFGLDH